MNDHHTLFHLQEDLANGQVTCKQLVAHYLEQIKAKQHLNAFLEVFEVDAMAQAEAIDDKIKTGTAGKLHGLVIGIKDVISYKDHKVSASSKILEGFEAVYNATVTQRLLDADAIIIGRLNCDEFAMGGSNENSAYGNVLNAFDETRVPGGSSGGSAVAVQAGLCHASLGTDTGGSIRQPSSFCGTVGLKPTYGRVSRWGVVAYASSFDQVGPITKSVEDAAVIMEVLAGADGKDATLSRTQVPAYSQHLELKDKPKVAYMKEVLDHEGLDPEIRQAMLDTLDKLKAAGHVVEAVEFPYLDHIVPAYYVLTTAEASSNLARYDGVHYGYRSSNAKTMDEVYTLSRSEGFGPEVKRRIMLGTFVLSAGYYDAYYGKAQKVRRLIMEATRKILADYDMLVLPTTPTTAFEIGGKIKDPIAMYLADIYTVQANLAGLPAVSIPAGKHSDGMPFGLQVISDRFKEGEILAFSKYLIDNILG